MQYFLTKDDGTKIEAQPERWCWDVRYQDGAGLQQFGEDGVYHQVKDIDQEKIALAVLYRFDDPDKAILIPWKEGMKIIHFYVNVHSAEQHADIADRARVYVFGYKDGNQTHYTHILPNDQMIYSSDRNIDLTKFDLL